MTTDHNKTDRNKQTDQQTILIAVNDIFFYTKIRDALLPNGYVLERVRTLDEVSQKLSALRPRAMIVNMNDPSLDAFRALEAVRGSNSLQSMPILAFANHEEVETWRRAKELGVTKIVSRNEFSARTKDLVAKLLSEQPAAGSERPIAGSRSL
jgi:PleD family two-component response regulator